MIKLLILSDSEGNEAAYLGGKLIDYSTSGNPLGEGKHRMWLLETCERFSLTSKEVAFANLTVENEDYVHQHNWLDELSSFPDKQQKEFSNGLQKTNK